MHVLVLGGGSSTEREVSLRSAKAVADALVIAGYDVLTADSNEGDSVFQNLPEGTIVFPILHGNGEEDGTIQRRIEGFKLPYLGSDSDSSALCFSKSRTREAYQKAGLPIAAGISVSRSQYMDHELRLRPHVLKVSEGGSSIGTLIVHNPHKMDDEKVDEVFRLGSEAVLEELVEGIEITVPVLDKTALPVIEIQAPEGQEFDYENKYNGATKEICPPVSVDKKLQKQAQEYAQQAHEILGCRHISRTDIIVRPDGTMILLETNTMPGMTDKSLFPLAAKTAGLDMQALVTNFVAFVRRDYKLQ